MKSPVIADSRACGPSVPAALCRPPLLPCRPLLLPCQPPFLPQVESCWQVLHSPLRSVQQLLACQRVREAVASLVPGRQYQRHPWWDQGHNCVGFDDFLPKVWWPQSSPQQLLSRPTQPCFPRRLLRTLCCFSQMLYCLH